MELNDNLHIKIKDCIKNFLVSIAGSMPFYAHFNLNLNFKETQIDTCGVNITGQGMNFYYSKDFLDKLTQKEFQFVNIHELYHLLFDHPSRTIYGSFDKKMANIVQDMIINHLIWTQIDHRFIDIPKIFERKNEDGEVINKDMVGRNSALFVPKDYTGPLIFESLYGWVYEKKQEYDKNPKKLTQKEKYGEHSKLKGVDCYSLEAIFENLDNGSGEYLDVHLDDEIPNELRQSIIDNFIDNMRTRGLMSRSHESVVGLLRKKKKDYLKEIKRSLSSEIFGRQKSKTITKPNRRGIEGIKGNNKKSQIINCILDVSGSMDKLTEKVLNYIYRNDIIINLVQVDAKVNKVEQIKSSSQLSKLKVKGKGGTALMPGVNYIVENYNQYNTVILTDGYCDRLDLSQLKGKTLIISAGVKCNIKGGKCKQILIGNE